MLPSFGTIAAFSAMGTIASARGVDINWALVLHGEQDLEIRQPIPRSGEVTSQPRVAHIYDKGRAALIVVEVTSTDQQTAGGAVHQQVFVVHSGGRGVGRESWSEGVQRSPLPGT